MDFRGSVKTTKFMHTIMEADAKVHGGSVILSNSQRDLDPGMVKNLENMLHANPFLIRRMSPS